MGKHETGDQEVWGGVRDPKPMRERARYRGSRAFGRSYKHKAKQREQETGNSEVWGGVTAPQPIVREQKNRKAGCSGRSYRSTQPMGEHDTVQQKNLRRSYKSTANDTSFDTSCDIITASI